MNYRRIIYVLSLFCITCWPRVAETAAPPISARCRIAQPKTLPDSLTHDHTGGILCVTSCTHIKLTSKLSIYDRHRLAVETHGSYNLDTRTQLLVCLSPRIGSCYVIVNV